MASEIPSGMNESTGGINDLYNNQNVEQSLPGSGRGRRTKRAARAYHTEYTTPTVPNTNVTGPSQWENGNYLPEGLATGIGNANSTGQNNTNEQEDLSIASTRFLDQLEYMTPAGEDRSVYKSFFTFQNIIPPVAGTQFHTVDQGTASSKFIRSTMYNVPENEEMRKATLLPVAVTVRPFAPLLDTEEAVPVVDARSLGKDAGEDVALIGPPRCNRCRAYMNPAMQHNFGNKFSCNICLFPNNTVSSDYMTMMNSETNFRMDMHSRPELHKGVYDFIVPDIYNVKGPGSTNNVLHHLFLIDISELSVKQELPSVVADAIRAGLYSTDETSQSRNDHQLMPIKYGIIAFDRRLHFYNLSSSLDATQKVILSDLDDPFVPFYEGLFVDPDESMICIEDVLNDIQMSNVENDSGRDSENCFAAACRAAMMCLDFVGGGQITAVLSCLPTWGPGGLRYKDTFGLTRNMPPEKEKELLNPDSDYYKHLAKDFLERNVGLSCFVVSPTAVDLSNIGWLCFVTGGAVSRWTNFDVERDGKYFASRFIDNMRKERGYQGQLKLRCSNGLQVAQYYQTSSSISSTNIMGSRLQDPIIPVLNEDQTFTVLLNYDGSLDPKYDCHFQAALLYTDTLGLRKVRVINLVLAVSEKLEDVFNFVEQDAVVTAIVRDTLSFVGKETLTELRLSVNEKLVDIFSQFRAVSEMGYHRNATLSNQFLFPNSLKNLPLYILALTKSRALTPSSSVSADSRLYTIFLMLGIPIERLLYYLYPALVELHSLEDDEGMMPLEANPDKFIKLPKYKNLISLLLERSVYVLCNGFNIYVWIHPDANKLILKDLFGQEVETVDDINPLMGELPSLDTHISLQTRNLIKFFQSEIIGCSSNGLSGVIIVRHGLDGSEMLFRECFVEDELKSPGIVSGLGYHEYLSNLHRAVKVKLENDKSSNVIRNSIKSLGGNADLLAQKFAQL